MTGPARTPTGDPGRQRDDEGLTHGQSTAVRPPVLERAVTIYDVAAAAGVSASTVSRAFSRPGRVSARTANHVHDVAERLGYRVDQVFRPPSVTRTKTIGLAVSDITNPFFFPIIRGAEQAASTFDHVLMLTDAQESDRLERTMLARILPLIDGLVIASSRVSDTELRMLARIVPVVVLNRHVLGLPNVMPDTARGVRRAAEHLASLGHRRILYAAGPGASWIDGARWRALREASSELGLTETRIGPYAPSVEGGRSAAAEVSARGGTAVLCFNDLMAIGLIRGLRELGLSVPEDVSVVGFDNIFAADLITPGLTTVAAPLDLLGDAAVRNVIALRSGARSTQDEPTVVPARLVVRDSTGPCRAVRP